jgi:hypothetical protein
MAEGLGNVAVKNCSPAGRQRVRDGGIFLGKPGEVAQPVLNDRPCGDALGSRGGSAACQVCPLDRNALQPANRSSGHDGHEGEHDATARLAPRRGVHDDWNAKIRLDLRYAGSAIASACSGVTSIACNALPCSCTAAISSSSRLRRPSRSHT